MLKPQTSMLEPRPSDRIRIGDCVVDLSLRRIAPIDTAETAVEPVRVTLKSIGVLSVLIAHHGKLVSRDALLEWVWPDTMPTDDVVTQAIAQLRKALHDDREHPRYIDTLAKQGYRLIAPIEWLEEPDTATEIIDRGAARAASPVPSMSAPAPLHDAPSSGDAMQASHRMNRRSIRARPVAGFVLSLVVVALFVALKHFDFENAPSPIAAPRPEPVALRPIPIRRIVSMPSRESDPSLSPDGAQIAYSRYPKDAKAAVLMVQTTAAVTPRELTSLTPGQWDLWPSWSPDGRQIAFLRSSEGRCRVMLLPATGGTPRDVAPCSDSGFPLAWYPDGKALVGIGATEANVDNSGRALFRLDIANGVWSPIAYARSAEDIDVWPRVSPDGRWIAFQRNLSLGDLWRIPVEGGTPERLTSLRANFFGLSWTSDSRGLVFSHAGRDGIVLSMLDLVDRRMRDYIPEDWALKQPVVAGSTVAFVIEDSQSSLRRLSLNDASKGDDYRVDVDAERLFASTRSEVMPSIAPDGRQLFFASDRDGSVRLWWVDQSRPDGLRAVDGFEPVLRYPAVWNADSSRALVLGEAIHRDETHASDNGGRESNRNDASSRAAIYEVDAQSGRATRLAVPDRVPVHAAYHPDPNRLLVVAEREQGRLGLVLYDRSRTPWKALAEINDVVMAVTDAANDRVVFVRTYKPGIWQADLELKAPREIDRVGMPGRIRTLVAATDGAWFLDVRPGCRWYWRPLAEPKKPDGRCLGDGPLMPQGLSYDAGRGQLYVGIANEAGRDIGVLPLHAFGLPGGEIVAVRD
jgi:Tol biopolymer transport system component/DNA-binding winged helix-turn-helix (wHTH) protein